MVSLIELIFILLTSFGFNLIPFVGPSNLFIASNAALVLTSTDPTTLVAIGFLVAFGAALAKSIHYLAAFFIGKHLSQNRRERLDADAVKVKRWAFWLLYIAAATPIPDEPVVIPLGLMKYSTTKFFTAFFLGKLSITIIGAFLGAWTKSTLSEWFSPEVTIALAVILTIVVTVILLKVDVAKLIERITEKYLKRKTTAKMKTPNPQHFTHSSIVFHSARETQTLFLETQTRLSFQFALMLSPILKNRPPKLDREHHSRDPHQDSKQHHHYSKNQKPCVMNSKIPDKSKDRNRNQSDER